MGEVLMRFSLAGQVFVITGGAGLLGVKHAEAILEAGGHPVLVDKDQRRVHEAASLLSHEGGCRVLGLSADITDIQAVRRVMETTLAEHSRLDGLVNNAANNPKMEDHSDIQWMRIENFPVETWDQDIAVGLTGAFLCSQVIGTELASQGHGVILNIASDLSVIAPDQRLYRKADVPEDQQPVKSVTYSVVKSGLVGLTRYLATYWATSGVRVNALSPGGVFNGQDEAFVQRLNSLIPMGRMASVDEYKAAVVFLLSDASSYMTGANVVMDGGRTTW